jgi:hypothetical protein
MSREMLSTQLLSLDMGLSTDYTVRLYGCSLAFTLGSGFSVLLYLLWMSMGDMML